MEIETIVKVATALVAIVGIGRHLYDVISGNKPKLRDEYRFARDFLSDVEKAGYLHPFALEKGYHAIAGTTNIRSQEVAYLLTLDDPAKCLRDFVLSRKHTELLNITGDLKIGFAKKYQKNWSRKWRKYLYICSYAMFAFGAIAPLLFAKSFGFQPKPLLSLIVFTLPVFGFIAWSSLKSFASIYRGERLIENQNTHTRRIVIPDSPRPS